MDFTVEQWINGPAGSHPLIDSLMSAVANGAEMAFAALVVAWFLAGLVRRSEPDRRGAVAALLAAAIALAVNQVLSHLWVRERPFVDHPGAVHQLVAHAADASFPSDHAAAAFAIAVILVGVHRRLGVAALGVAVLVSYARVYTGLHYPGDVLAGTVIGVIAAIAVGLWLTPITAAATRLGDRLLVGVRLLPEDG